MCLHLVDSVDTLVGLGDFDFGANDIHDLVTCCSLGNPEGLVLLRLVLWSAPRGRRNYLVGEINRLLFVVKMPFFDTVSFQ